LFPVHLFHRGQRRFFFIFVESWNALELFNQCKGTQNVFFLTGDDTGRHHFDSASTKTGIFPSITGVLLWIRIHHSDPVSSSGKRQHLNKNISGSYIENLYI
jgi:hypothetical protein